MQSEASKAAKEWLARADRDLGVAARVLSGDDPFPDAAAFHSQQAAEKALKGFLAAHEVPFPKTHDLERLVQWCGNIEAEFAHFADAAQTLSPYVVRFRYPLGPLEPDMAEAEEAIRLAREIVQFVRDRLSPGS